MTPDESFEHVKAQLERGEASGASEVFRRFARRLIALASSRLHDKVKDKVDPEDVVQSALRSFFVRQAGGQFELRDWGGLWAILVVITLRKCRKQFRLFSAGRRAVGRERSLDAAGPDDRPTWEALADDPTPDEAAQLADLVERILSGLGPRERPIVEFRLQGYTVEETSRLTGRSERTCHRVLSDVRTRLKDLLTHELE